MLDIGASELLLTVIVAIVVIGPKDLPRALRMAGGWIAKVRRVSGHFRSGIEEMIRQAELEDMEKKWREQNEKIMAETAAAGAGATAESAALPDYNSEPTPAEFPAAESQAEPPTTDNGALVPADPATEAATMPASPELPLAPPKANA